MPELSLYHSATGKQSPHCVHVVGIGKTGAQMLDAFLRTGEVEDLLEDPRARFTALAVDVGAGDMYQLREYAEAFLDRLRDRGIPTERAQIRTVSLPVPDRDELMGTLGRYQEFLEAEYPRVMWKPDYTPWLPADIELPKGDKRYTIQLEQPDPREHVPRALAKAIYGQAYYAGTRPLERELEDFAQSINRTRLPSLVLVCFGLGGGTGSGMVVDLARHLSTVKLGRRIPVIGVGVLPCSGDPDHHRGASLYTTLNELDCMLDDDKNQAVTAMWGDLYKNPFTGGFFLLPQEQAWQRLHRYTEQSAGQPQIRHRQGMHVTNKFIDDSFARYVVNDYGRELFRVLRPAGFTGAPHERISYQERNWTLFNVAKLTHPGVQVLPGEPMSKWRAVIGRWIEYIPQWSGLKEGFKTEYIEAHTFSPRVRWNDTLQRKLEETLQKYLLPGDDGTLRTFENEFFDELTVYTNVIIPGVARTDLTAFYQARDAYDKLSREEKLLCHSWLLDVGVLLCEPSTRVAGMTGECLLDGCGCWLTIPHADIRGEAPVSAHVAEVTQASIADAVKTVVPTP
ncbi:hypothetical protein C3Y87_13280 [Carbonactinospora thermoautotrophica]|nr:hypothetical protein [Carbonactinospora thermoautotrophica]